MRKILVSINRIALEEKIERNDTKRWNTYHDAWEPHEVTPLELYDKVCRGHSFGPIFEGPPECHRPLLENFVLTQVIGIDVDEGDYHLDELIQNPAVRAHGAIIYPTMSSTRFKPRHRVVFILDEPITSPDEFRLYAEGIGQMFGGVDRGSYSPAKTYFGNGRIAFENKWPETYYPLHLSPQFSLTRTDLRIYGKQLEIARLREEQMRVREWRKNTTPRQHGEGQMTLSELETKLRSLDPYSLDRDEWVTLGAAIAHTYGEEAYPMFKQWSDREGHAPMTRAEWNSMAKPGEAGYGSIIHILHKERAL